MATFDQQRVSDQLVRLVQVFFALVLGQSLVLFKAVLLSPFTPDYRLAALAWATVVYTTVASWVDWHVVMARRPYDTRQLIDRFRIYSDVGIAALYAYLLFTIEPLIGNTDGPLFDHLVGYPLVFLLYLSSGFLRRLTHGRSASKPLPLVFGLFAYTALLYGYGVIYVQAPVDFDRVSLNAITLSVAFLLMFSYRWYRHWLVKQDEKREARLAIGIDVDGVLADQISGVLPKIRARHDVTLAYADITAWELPIKDSNIALEIVDAQKDHDYVVNMGVHEGAKRVLGFIHKWHRIVIITARKGDAATIWTAEWLRKHGLAYDEVIAVGEAKKSEHRTDVLIDDFTGNISEFLANTSGIAVLVDQPWNRERDALDAFVASGRLFIVANLLEVRASWAEIVEKARGARKNAA